MHDTAKLTGGLFLQWVKEKLGSHIKVIDIGGMDVNGSLRDDATSIGILSYTSVDVVEDSSVDIVHSFNKPLPFESNSVDVILSTSCFEHDPCFWVTFREMCRILKPTGYIYVNAPSNGPYHGYPGDNWRFYTDTAQALSYWCSQSFYQLPTYSIPVVEVFYVFPLNDIWIDFVAVWTKVEELDVHGNNVRVSTDLLETTGELQQNCQKAGLQTGHINILTESTKSRHDENDENDENDDDII